MATDKSLKIAILGYANSGLVPPWDPSNCENGLPGSEEAAVYATQELANRGHQVTVYMNPPLDSMWQSSSSNPRWIHADTWNDYKNKEKYDLVLMWRRFDVETGRKRSEIVFFWPHDSPPNIPSGSGLPLFPNFDGVCILSQHHWDQFGFWPRFKEVPYIISGNGVLPDHFGEQEEWSDTTPSKRQSALDKSNPYSVGYFSNYARGLIVLMMIWPQIRQEFPEATLDIYYGRETWNTMSEGDFNFVIQKMKQYKDLGVTERGKIGHQELAKEMQRISVFAYPCLWPIGLTETFCITAVKAQMAGCIPVTTRIGALDETIHFEAPSIPNIKTMIDIKVYTEKLLETLRRIRNTDPKLIVRERQKYIDFSQQFTWTHCVDKWIELYNRVKQWE